MEGALTDRVVAGIDLTPIGRRVAERARMLADTHQLPLHLISVNESSSEAFLDEGLGRLLFDRYSHNLAQVATWIEGRANVPVTHQALRGSIGWELVREAKKASIVVVGTSAVDVERCGPIARRVSIMSTGDVLVVRRQPRTPYRKVLAAVDFSHHSQAAVEAALRWYPDADLTAIFSLAGSLGSGSGRGRLVRRRGGGGSVHSAEAGDRTDGGVCGSMAGPGKADRGGRGTPDRNRRSGEEARG